MGIVKKPSRHGNRFFPVIITRQPLFHRQAIANE